MLILVLAQRFNLAFGTLSSSSRKGRSGEAGPCRPLRLPRASFLTTAASARVFSPLVLIWRRISASVSLIAGVRRHCVRCCSRFRCRRLELLLNFAPSRGVLSTFRWTALPSDASRTVLPAADAESARQRSIASTLHSSAVVAALAKRFESILLLCLVIRNVSLNGAGEAWPSRMTSALRWEVITGGCAWSRKGIRTSHKFGAFTISRGLSRKRRNTRFTSQPLDVLRCSMAVFC